MVIIFVSHFMLLSISNVNIILASRLTMLEYLSKIELPHQKGRSFLFHMKIQTFVNSTYNLS